MQTKAQLIDAIMQINPTAQPHWLDRFDVGALRRYLDHLNHALEPRGSFWIRDVGVPAAMTRAPAA